MFVDNQTGVQDNGRKKLRGGLALNETNLLIVDDEQMIRNGLKCGIAWDTVGIDRVFTAEDSVKALQVCRENSIHIVITDICMPEIDGLELGKRLRHIYPAIRIIMLSGRADFEYAQQALRLGAIDYLLKPIDVKELMHCVEVAAEQSRRTRQQMEQELQNIAGFTQKHKAVPGSGIAIHDELFSRDADVKPSAGFSSMILKVVDYINLNFREPVSAQMMAELVGLSKNYFSSLFKKEMRISFVEYLNRVRVYQAKRLLKNTSFMTYEIAEIVGYSNYNYFSTVFKNVTGRAPSEYRKTDD